MDSVLDSVDAIVAMVVGRDPGCLSGSDEVLGEMFTLSAGVDTILGSVGRGDVGVTGDTGVFGLVSDPSKLWVLFTFLICSPCTGRSRRSESPDRLRCKLSSSRIWSSGILPTLFRRRADVLLSVEPFSCLTRAARPGDNRRKMDVRTDSSRGFEPSWESSSPLESGRGETERGLRDDGDGEDSRGRKGDRDDDAELNCGADNFLDRERSEALAGDATMSDEAVVVELALGNMEGMDPNLRRRPNRQVPSDWSDKERKEVAVIARVNSWICGDEEIRGKPTLGEYGEDASEGDEDAGRAPKEAEGVTRGTSRNARPPRARNFSATVSRTRRRRSKGV